MISNGSGTLTTGQAVESALRRLKTIWKAQGWTPELLGEYRRVLARLGDPQLVEAVTDQVIDQTTERFCPPPGVFARTGEEVKAAMRRRQPVVPEDWRKEPVDLEAVAADAPPLVAAAIRRARARMTTTDERTT